MKTTPYQYDFNSPLIWKDPSGLKGEKERWDKMMGMETLLLQIANFFVDVTRNMVDNSNKNCKCSDTWACPCANDDKGGGSGGSGGKSKFQSPTEANISKSDLPSSGVPNGESPFDNLGRTGGGQSSLGSGAVNHGGINSFERVVAKWESNEIQSYINQTILMMATTKTGQQMLSTIWSYGRIPDIEVVSGFMIRQVYGYDSEDNFYSPVNGLFRGSTTGTFLIASEAFDYSKIIKYLFYETDLLGLSERMEPWMIIVHEFNHYIQSFTNKFILSIMNQGLGFDFFKVDEKRMERECFDKVNAIMDERRYPYKWVYPQKIRLR